MSSWRKNADDLKNEGNRNGKDLAEKYKFLNNLIKIIINNLIKYKF